MVCRYNNYFSFPENTINVLLNKVQLSVIFAQVIRHCYLKWERWTYLHLPFLYCLINFRHPMGQVESRDTFYKSGFSHFYLPDRLREKKKNLVLFLNKHWRYIFVSRSLYLLKYFSYCARFSRWKIPSFFWEYMSIYIV